MQKGHFSLEVLELGFLKMRRLSVFAPDPAAHVLAPEAATRLRGFVLEHAGALAVLTGAGISTPSGIPDYRGAEGSYSKGHEPMQHADFVRRYVKV